MLNFEELQRYELRELLMDIRKGEHLSEALFRHGKPAIPTNVILNKGLPGLGASYCEIEADRPSIIIEPNVPVIINKAKKHPHLMGVYKGVTTDHVVNYLRTHKKRPKLMTTPESFWKIKQALEEEAIDMYSHFFMLFDECEKIVQDIDYRETMEIPLEDFFRFRSKAFVSATPLLPYDPRFKEAGFTTLRIKPDVVLISDLHGAEQSVIDPATEAIQIAVPSGSLKKSINN